MTDDPELIPDDVDLHRRVPTYQVKPGGIPSSQAFSEIKMSCDDSRKRPATQTHADGGSDKAHAEGGVAVFETVEARGRGLGVAPDPEFGNDAHVTVEGKKSKSIKRALAQHAAQRGWVITPKRDKRGNPI